MQWNCVLSLEVPDRLKIVRVERIQNLQNWAEFRLRQREVLEEINKLKERGEKGVCSNGHELEPLGTTMDNGWACDGRNDGGCVSGITDFNQTKGKNRFRCAKCDFDYCDKCYSLRTGAKLCMNGHPLVPLGTTRDNGWGCDNHSTPAGCLLKNKTKGVDRYRCEQCDYDLCDKCYEKHIGHVLNNIKTDQMDLHSGESDKDSNTVWLFHGTSTEAAALITRGDFLVDKAGSNAGTLYGRGIYLAESCSKSDEYSRENADGHRCILLCRAVLGNILYNDEVSPNIDWDLKLNYLELYVWVLYDIRYRFFLMIAGCWQDFSFYNLRGIIAFLKQQISLVIFYLIFIMFFDELYYHLRTPWGLLVSVIAEG